MQQQQQQQKNSHSRLQAEAVLEAALSKTLAALVNTSPP